ncbi:CocE/NonD family hydrolase [Dongia deserti]|uniref:CocE/NonD family hydrolase n=1 Tax=Dongia deserti TaxID=2268030 RepID=UPI000E657F83|nr:CocE/NonD family hydrolase [Dongia deserti]
MTVHRKLDELPNKIKKVEHFWITLKDGCRLAARMWLPEDAETHPVPAILEYIPYRKRDGTRGRDEPMHGYFAGHGYAAIRVDMRGSGESDDVLQDEYLQLELDDAVEVIDWITRQRWCDGKVGMMGKSWGGFNCLQIAAMRPEPLKAVLSVCSTDDRYADDIHYMGGCLLNDNHWWGAIMMGFQARPADPLLFGEGWRENWLKRLDEMPFWPALWMKHPTRDDYWRHGSICEDYGAIQCPVMLVGGWADAYTNAIPRMLEHLKVPRRAIIGPWAHLYPHDGMPGPAFGFLQEAVKWWDHWLKNAKNGAMDGPMLWSWLEDGAQPTTTATYREGRWVGDQTWPSPSVATQAWSLGAGVLSQSAQAAADLAICSPQTVGIGCGEWMGAGCPGEMPLDQRIDDAGSLVFDSATLTQDLDLLGFPVLDLEFSVDRAVAQVGVRLSDLFPDGAALRASYAVFNLNHLAGHDKPQRLEPGKRYRARIKLNVLGHRFAAGHRLRLAISTAYWPLIWPTPERIMLTVHTANTRLELPVRAPQKYDGANPFAPPESAPLTPVSKVAEGRIKREIHHDLLTGVVTYVTDGEGGVFGEGILRFDEIDVTVNHALRRELVIHPDDPLSAHYRITQSQDLKRDGWDIHVETETIMASTNSELILTGRLDAYENGKRVASRNWRETVARTFL